MDNAFEGYSYANIVYFLQYGATPFIIKCNMVRPGVNTNMKIEWKKQNTYKHVLGVFVFRKGTNASVHLSEKQEEDLFSGNQDVYTWGRSKEQFLTYFISISHSLREHKNEDVRFKK